MAEMLTIDDFTPHVGKTVRFLDTPFSLALDRVEAGAGGAPTTARAPFLVIFRGPRTGAVMAEGFYQCAIEGGPTLSLYVQPIHTPARDRQEYQASFN